MAELAFGYKSLADLVGGMDSQLSPMRFRGDVVNSTVDFNSTSYTRSGWYILRGDSAHSPVTSGLVLLEVFNSQNTGIGGESMSIVQKVTTLSTGLPEFYMRTSWGGWNDWKKIG